MTGGHLELLERLIDATGQPPPLSCSAGVVLREARQMIERRKEIVDRLVAMGPSTDPTLEQLWAELQAVERLWEDRIRRAREGLRPQVTALGRMRPNRTRRARALTRNGA